jgi:acyl-CoA oxidase
MLRFDSAAHEPAAQTPTWRVAPEDLSKKSGIRRRLQPGALAERVLDAGDVTRWLYEGSAEAQSFRDRVKALLAGPEFAPRPGMGLADQARLSYDRFQLVRDRLELRLRDVQERPARLAAALELIGVVDATLFTVMNIHYSLCGGTLLRHLPSCPELEGYIEELDSGETIGAFLMTELGYGNNVISLQTRVDYDREREELVLCTPSPEARKFMPNSALPGVPKLGVVMARLFVQGTDHGIFPVVARLRTSAGVCPGVSIVPLGDKPGFSLDNGITSFDAVRLPRHCLLLGEHSGLDAEGKFWSRLPGRRARFLRSIEQIHLGRLALSGVGATATGASAFIAIKYGEQRRTFAPRQPDLSVLEYRNHQRDLFSALAQAYASRLLVDFAMAAHGSTDSGEHDYLFRITAATKAHVTYAAERHVRLCRERCGAAAMFEENRLAVYATQAQGLVTAEGDNQIILIKIARQMLMRLGYVRLRPSRDLGASPLSDPARLLALIRERERRLLDELRSVVARARMRNEELFEIWNDNINLAIEAALAHSSRLATEAFAARLSGFDDEHPVVDLFRLFVLQEMSPHLGFYLAEELISPQELKEHSRRLDALCGRLRPFALDLASACDVPNELLRAPLASEDYVSYYDQLARRGQTDCQTAGETERGTAGETERETAGETDPPEITRGRRTAANIRLSSSAHAR